MKLFDSSTGFPPLCPDLVVELASPSDEGPRGADGVGAEPVPQRLEGATQLEGGALFPGLALDLEEIWAS